MMPRPYGIIIAAILLLPWCLILPAMIGMVWSKARTRTRF
jgi:hypothetical protein